MYEAYEENVNGYSLHVMSDGAVYCVDDQDVYRVFVSLDDAKRWTETKEEYLVIIETKSQEHLDRILLDMGNKVQMKEAVAHAEAVEGSDISDICQECWDPDCKGC